MGMTEALFDRLIDKTDALLDMVRPSSQNAVSEEMDRLFAERELLLKQLYADLQHAQDIDHYRPIYESWQMKERELAGLVEASLLKLKGKVKGIQNARNVSRQYNSYLKQMPFGAFVDDKQ